MYQKFIITQNGILRFGCVYLHRDLLTSGEQCPYGGGLWKLDESRGAILLYGSSFDFGYPELSQIKSVEWDGVGGKPMPLFFLPYWPKEERLIPIYTDF